ncbi:MAG TPA: LPS export ABC transporter permease LptG [Bdellovibrionota bacterium]|jgi:lipopolysaccharide export system permease protein|nr:LPS export ABC transporter permease LptG [Bdellovibrionota bacterium]
MRILARYISGIFVRNFILAVLGLTALFTFQSLITELLDLNYPARQTVIYEMLKIPETFVQMCPPAVMIATVLTLAGLNRTHELIAMYSIGVGLSQIATVVFALVFMISCFNLVLQDRILPPVYRKRMGYYWTVMKGQPDFFLDVKQNKIWYRSNNLIYSLRTFDSRSRSIQGMTVYEFDKGFRLVHVIEADQARYIPGGGWKLEDGITTKLPPGDEFPVTEKFGERDLKIAQTPDDFLEIGKRVSGLRLKELSRYIDMLRQTGIDTKGSEVTFHSRISLSFIPLVMAFLAIPFSVRSRREGGTGRDLALCLAITFFYWIFYSIGLSLGTKGALPPWLAAWLPSLIFMGAAAVLISRKTA